MERQIRNCTEAIASMGLSNSLRARLTDLETVQHELAQKLKSSEPNMVRLQMMDTKRFVENRLKNLHSMWAGEGRLVRAEIAKRENHTHAGRAYLRGIWDMGFGWKCGC